MSAQPSEPIAREVAGLKRTPGPWVARKDPDSVGHDDWCIGVVGDHYPIDCVATCSARDAAFIVKACNNYDSVLAERDALKTALSACLIMGAIPIEVYSEAREVLAKVSAP